MMNAMTYLKMIIIIQLIFSFSITMITYALPSDLKNYMTNFNPTHTVNTEGLSSELQQKLESAKNIPIYDMVALLFYTGNMFIDIFLNFLFALPEIATIILGGIFILIPINPYLAVQLKLFIFGISAIFYLILVITIIVNIRSGRMIT